MTSPSARLRILKFYLDQSISDSFGNHVGDICLRQCTPDTIWCELLVTMW